MKAFERRRLLGFLLAGVASIAGLVWIADVSRESDARIDRYTGQEIDAPEERPLVERIRDTGDAAAARELLVEVVAAGEAPGQVADYLDLLNAELAEPGELPDAALPPPAAAGPVALLDWLDGAAGAAAGDAALLDLFRSPDDDVSTPLRAVEIAERVDAFEPPDRLAAAVVASWMGHENVPAAAAFEVARRFRGAERPRARLRWLRRVLRREPDDVRAVEALATALVEYGLHGRAARVLAAARAVGTHSPATLELEVNLHRWSGNRRAELVVLEFALAVNDGAEARDRLTALASAAGDEARAVRHALAAATIDPAPSRLRKTAELVARMGRPGEALDLYERLAQIEHDPRPALLELGRLARDVQELDRAIDAFERAHELRSDPETGTALEDLYRRTGRTTELVELLASRTLSELDSRSRQELLGLSWQLGRRDVADRVVRQELAQDDLDRVLWNLPAYALVAPTATYERLADLLAATEPASADASVPFRLRDLSNDATVGEGVRGALADPRAGAWRDALDALGRGAVVAAAGADVPPPTDAELLELALAAARSRPDDVEAWRRVAETASWAEQDGVQVRALERLVELGVDDRETRERLAHLLETTGRTEDAVPLWAALAAEDGPGSVADLRWIDSLYATGRDAEAEELLARRADGAQVSRETLHSLAAIFLERQAVDRALDIHLRLVAEDDTDVLANRRAGEILSWSHDPGGAVPYLERAVELTDREDAELLHLLAEALWSINDTEHAADVSEESLPKLRALDPLLPLHESMIARTLARLGEGDESTAIYERLIGEQPRNQDVRLDHVVSLVILLEPDEARRVLDEARPLGAETRRFLRLDGQLLIDEDRPEQALVQFDRYVELHGDDAGVRADMGRAHVLADEPHAAVLDFDRALELQPGNLDVARLRRRAFDRSADVAVELDVRLREVSDDAAFSTRLEASIPLIADSLRLSGAWEHGRYEGRAAAFKGGREDVEESVERLSLGLSHRLARRALIGAGVDLYSGGRERRKVGGWAGMRVQEMAPFRSVELRAWRNELFADPPAAVGLGGTEDGFSVERFSAFGDRDRWWWIARAEWTRLEIDVRRAVRRDRRIEGELAVGHWFLIGEHVIQDGIRARRPEPLREGARVTGETDAQDQPAVAGWVAWSPSRLRDDHELIDELPMGSRFDYLTVNALVADELTSGLTAQVQPFLGYELHEGEVQGGVGVRLAYRPRDAVEVRLGLDWGRARGRSETSDATSFQLAVTLRW